MSHQRIQSLRRGQLSACDLQLPVIRAAGTGTAQQLPSAKIGAIGQQPTYASLAAQRNPRLAQHAVPAVTFDSGRWPLKIPQAKEDSGVSTVATGTEADLISLNKPT